MKPRRTMCPSCPFRGISQAERRDLAACDPEDWPCHTEHPVAGGETQCRGHFEARRKYPPTTEDIARLEEWRRIENAKIVAAALSGGRS